MPAALLGLLLLLAQAPAGGAQGEPAPPGFAWGEVRMEPGTVHLGQEPLFRAELTAPADALELRVYSVTLELQHSARLGKPARVQGGRHVYEYRWPGAAGLPKGVYFYLFRATKAGFPALKSMKHFKVAAQEEERP